jgi:hypothetical protein
MLLTGCGRERRHAHPQPAAQQPFMSPNPASVSPRHSRTAFNRVKQVRDELRKATDQEDLFVLWGTQWRMDSSTEYPMGKRCATPCPSAVTQGVRHCHVSPAVQHEEHYADLDYGGSLTQGNVDTAVEGRVVGRHEVMSR